jgi:uncharacterized protein YjbI with pentapeptide repeats
MADALSAAGDPVADAVKSIRDTAKWVVVALAGVATAIAAGSQLSSLGALAFGLRLGLAVVAAVCGLLAVGVGIWLTIDMLLPTQIGLPELADSNNDSNRKVREYISNHPEFLQGQANSVGDLQNKYQAAVSDRDRKYAAAEADPANIPATEAANAANRQLVYLSSVVQSLLGFAALQQVLLSFASWRNKMVVVVIVAALAMLAFAWAANPPKPDGTTSLAGAMLSNTVLAGADLQNVDLSGANLRNADLRGAKLNGAKLTGVQWLGATCPDGQKADAVGGACKP